MSTGGKPSRAAATKRAPTSKRRIGQISGATSEIIKQAAALLDEEMAIGIVTANRMQQRFQNERRLNQADFADALQRFQSDGHELINLVDQQLAEFRSPENAELTGRLMKNVHDLVDLAVGLAGMGTEIANQLIEARLPRPAEQVRKRST